MVNVLLSIALFACFFTLGQIGLLDRRIAMLLGALVFTITGAVVGFYPPELVMESVWYETLALIFGMSIISATLAKSGLFEIFAQQIAGYVRGQGWPIVVLLSLVTYTASLFINNLATMVVILPITITLCQRMALNPVPVLIAEIIASNLGGASTMMGDFPNMIITAAGDLHFSDFISGMMAPCLILLGVMLIYLQRRDLLAQGTLFASAGISNNRTAGLSTDSDSHTLKVDHYLSRLGLGTLFVVLVGFLLVESTNIRPAVVAMLAGIFLLIFGRFSWRQIFAVGGLGDVLFFLGLFVMVGGLKAAGVLEHISWLIADIGSDSQLLELLALMWIAWAITPFLNAGPATAFFIPVAQEINIWIPGDVVWWALSLGILAGSSAALTGATSGPIAVSFLEKHRQSLTKNNRKTGSQLKLDFKEYLNFGLPISLLFLGFSSLYIAIIAP